MSLLRAAAIGMCLSGATKAVGSAFRVAADKDAPEDVFKTTMKREAILLGTGVTLTAALSPLLVHKLPQIGMLKNTFLGTEIGASVLAAITGLSVAETVSRAAEPPLTWKQKAELTVQEGEGHDYDDDHDDEFEDGPGRKLDVTSVSPLSKMTTPPTFAQKLATPSVAPINTITASNPFASAYSSPSVASPAVFNNSFSVR